MMEMDSSGLLLSGWRRTKVPFGLWLRNDLPLALDFAPQDDGRLAYRLRAHLWNGPLTHRFEIGLLHCL
jgi:hypothetical protein